MIMKWLQVVMVILMDELVSALPLEAEGRSSRVRRNTGDLVCPAGKYLKNNECSDCPTGSYTSQQNRETTCHSCYKDCRMELHMQVVKNCSKESDMECRCMDGYICSSRDYYSKRCSTCLPISTSQTTTTSTPHVTEMSPTKGMKEWIIVVVVLSIVLSFFITMAFCSRRKQYLKNLVKRCSHTNPKDCVPTTTSQETEPFRQTQPEKADSHPPTPTSCISDIPITQPASTEQPVLPPGKLGPLHIYGACTVFVSLLNQFGQNRGEKEEEHLQQGGLKESKLHCPSSPPLPLSTEENSTDSGSIFFPSQEQGKECHMSKEEGLY